MKLATAQATVNGIQIAYRDSGESGDTTDLPVVLVHGMGGDAHTWDRFARKLIGDGRRVVLPDLRGHGRSPHVTSYEFDAFGIDVLELCEHLGFAEIDLVGHSLGGYAASVVAQRRPDLVRRLVIEDSPIPLRPGDEPQDLHNRLPTLPALAHAISSAVRHPRALIKFDRSMTGPALTQFRQPNPLWWDSLPDITADTIFLRGTRGGMADPIKLEAAINAIPRGRIVPFEVGHSIHRDSYRTFSQIVGDFLAGQ